MIWDSAVQLINKTRSTETALQILHEVENKYKIQLVISIYGHSIKRSKKARKVVIRGCLLTNIRRSPDKAQWQNRVCCYPKLLVWIRVFCLEQTVKSCIYLPKQPKQFFKAVFTSNRDYISNFMQSLPLSLIGKNVRLPEKIYETYEIQVNGLKQKDLLIHKELVKIMI